MSRLHVDSMGHTCQDGGPGPAEETGRTIEPVPLQGRCSILSHQHRRHPRPQARPTADDCPE